MFLIIIYLEIIKLAVINPQTRCYFTEIWYRTFEILVGNFYKKVGSFNWYRFQV